MSLRILLYVLPVALAPLGVLGEGAVLEFGRQLVEPAEWSVDLLPRGPDGRTLTSPPPEGGGDGTDATPLPPSWRNDDTPRARAGSTAPAIPLADHLRRCGHDARHLDLPPPSRD